ncbi:MAG: hypothetical protein ACRBHB_05070 [Arenicella sp.]
MPIANCIVAHDSLSSSSSKGASSLVELWANESGKLSEHMTVNVVASYKQFGNKYPVMATLLLPSVWSDSDISLLQTGLAKALSRYFDVTLNEVHVVTDIIHSGMVVEEGKEVQW